MRLVRVSAAAVVLAASLAWGQAKAEKASLVELVPADSLFFLHWAGSNQVPGYADSKYAALLTGLNLPGWWEKTAPGLMPVDVRGTTQATAFLELVKAITVYATENESILFSTGEGVAEDLKVEPQATMVIRFPSETLAKEAERNIQDLISQILGAEPIPNVQFYQKGTDIGVKVKDLSDRSPLERPKVGMGESVGYQDALGEVKRAGSPVEFYLNVDKAIALGEKENEGDEEWEKKVKVMGLRGVHGVAMFGWEERGEFASHVFVAMDPVSERRGVVGSVATTRPAVDVTKGVPAEAVSVTTFSADLPEIWARFKREAEEMKPGSAQQPEAMVGLVAAALGLNLHEFLGNFGKDFAIVGLAGKEAGVWEYVLVSKPADAPKADVHLRNIAAGVNRLLLSQRSPVAPLTLTTGSVSNVAKGEAEIAAWGVTPEGYLVVGFTRGAVERAVSGKTMDASEMRKRLGAPEGAAVSWSDLPASVEGMYGNWAMALLPKLQTAPEWVRSLPILTTDQVKRVMSPSGSATWVTQKGLHYRSIAAFPGAEGFSALFGMGLGEGSMPKVIEGIKTKLTTTRPAQ